MELDQLRVRKKARCEPVEAEEDRIGAGVDVIWEGVVVGEVNLDEVELGPGEALRLEKLLGRDFGFVA